MPDEPPVVATTPEPPMTGAEDTLNVETTADDLAESLHLVESEDSALPPETGEPKGEEAPPPGPEVKGEPAKPVEAATKPAAEVKDEGPATWRPEAKAKWADVPAEVKAEISKREQDVARFTTDMGAVAGIGKTVQTILQPYEGLLRQNNINPLEHISNLLKGHTQLLLGTHETKVAMLRNMVRNLQVDPRELGGAPADPNAPAPAALDPRILGEFQRLTQENADLRNNVTGVAQTLYEARRNELTGSVQAFADDPAHPFFWEVAEDINNLINAKAVRSLEEGYHLAIQRNPVTRGKIIETEVAARAKAIAEQNRLKVVETRKATGANVKSRGAGRQPAPEETIDETLKTGLAAIKARG